MGECEALLIPLAAKPKPDSSELKKTAEAFAKQIKEAVKEAEKLAKEQAAQSAVAPARSPYITYAIAIGGAVALGLLLTRKK